MPKYICSTHSSNDNYNGDCDWAVIEMNPAVATRLLAFMNKVAELKALDSQFYSIELWNYFDVYSSSTLDSYDEDTYSNLTNGERVWDNFIPCPFADDPELDTERTDCHLVTITTDTLEWSCHPKNDNTVITTAVVDRSEVEAWAKGEFNV